MKCSDVNTFFFWREGRSEHLSHSLARTTRSKGRIQKPGRRRTHSSRGCLFKLKSEKKKERKKETHGSPASGARLSGIVWKCRDASQTVGSGDWLTFNRSLSGVTSGRCIENYCSTRRRVVGGVVVMVGRRKKNQGALGSTQ